MPFASADWNFEEAVAIMMMLRNGSISVARRKSERRPRNTADVPALSAKDPVRAELEKMRRATPGTQTENAKAGDVLQHLMNEAKRESGQIRPEEKDDRYQKPEHSNNWPEGLVESKAYWDIETRSQWRRSFYRRRSQQSLGRR